MIENGRDISGRDISKTGYIEVDKLPRRPQFRAEYWLNSTNSRKDYTHQLFKFPAKFHPPVVRWALETFGRKGSNILEPFTGSGTAQVEALVRGIDSVGFDIDPVASLVASVKTTPIHPERLERSFRALEQRLTVHLDNRPEAESLPGADITQDEFELSAEQCQSIPHLPNILHWFRRYVILDLARIFDAIEACAFSDDIRRFYRVCAASIIRNVSNADPTPVSGLEVTSIQTEVNQTRVIRVLDEFRDKCRREIYQMGTLWQAISRLERLPKALVYNDDVRSLPERFRADGFGSGDFSLVLTSPPYCRAVNYSRRHKLEMFWLGYTESAEEHVELTHSYIGRPYVRIEEWDDSNDFGIRELDRTLQEIREKNHHTARTVHHYFSSMTEVFELLRGVIRRTGTFVCIIGNSVCRGVPVTTADFTVELASKHFRLDNRFSYAIRNHYMQYGLRNGSGIKDEHVLVFKPR